MEDKNKQMDGSNMDVKNQTSSTAVQVTLNGTTSTIQWGQNIYLLDALLDAGIAAPYSCGRGNCGTCVCKVEEGDVRLRRNFILSETHLSEGLILTCVATPVSNKLTINYDQF